VGQAVAPRDVGEFVEEDGAALLLGPGVGLVRQEDRRVEKAHGHRHGARSRAEEPYRALHPERRAQVAQPGGPRLVRERPRGADEPRHRPQPGQER
jgi:hypothetical protein